MSGGTDEQDIAAAFVAARRAARGLAAYPGTPPDTLDAAYRIQDRAIAHDGGHVAGWKVGRILPPLDAVYGSDRLAGPIFRARVFAAAATPTAMPVFGEGFGAVEAEFVAVLGAVDPRQVPWTLAAAAALVERVHLGVEIASSPLGAINALGPAVTVSDFGNNHGLIVGPAIDDWRTAGLDDWPVTVDIDDVQAGAGSARAFADGMLGSVRFLLDLLAARGIAVPAGTLVSTGAITGVHQIRPGQRATARFAGAELFCNIVAAVPEAA